MLGNCHCVVASNQTDLQLMYHFPIPSVCACPLIDGTRPSAQLLDRNSKKSVSRFVNDIDRHNPINMRQSAIAPMVPSLTLQQGLLCQA
jgi:predicted secreted Zn-dependent protease